jgi:Protein of unknown function (DUF2934).
MESTTATKTTRSTAKRSTASVPTREAIEYRAYELYLQRGGCEGDALEDWLNAEQELFSAQPARKSRAA